MKLIHLACNAIFTPHLYFGIIFCFKLISFFFLCQSYIISLNTEIPLDFWCNIICLITYSVCKKKHLIHKCSYIKTKELPSEDLVKVALPNITSTAIFTCSDVQTIRISCAGPTHLPVRTGVIACLSPRPKVDSGRNVRHGRFSGRRKTTRQ